MRRSTIGTMNEICMMTKKYRSKLQEENEELKRQLDMKFDQEVEIAVSKAVENERCGMERQLER